MLLVISGGISLVVSGIMLALNKVSSRSQDRANLAKTEADTDLAYAKENRELRGELRSMRQVLQAVRDLFADVVVPVCAEHRPDLSDQARQALSKIDEVL